jgi:protein-S-isoprenylcysteine O-methyltransferase Ste14
MNKSHAKVWMLVIAKMFFTILFIALLIFVSAGTLDYWQGWAVLTAYIFTQAASIYIFRNNLEFLKERAKPGAGMKKWDKFLLGILAVSQFVVFIIGGLDVGRFGWSGEIPVFLYIICWLLFTGSFGVAYWAMYVNQFFSSVVRIQKDRGQFVVQEGPYRYVRHPGYISFMITLLALSICLGSYYALIPAFIGALALVGRTHLEDNALKNELEGYREYTEKVRYRLVPGLW